MNSSTSSERIDSRQAMSQTDESDSDRSQNEDDSVEEDATDDGSNSSCCSENTTTSRHSSSSCAKSSVDGEDEKLTINIKLVGKESSKSLMIDPSSSVGDLKRQIANLYSVPIERQRLIFFGKLLLDNAQALGPKGACMRLGTINYVHLSPLPDGAKPSDRPNQKTQPPPQPPTQQPPPPYQHEYSQRSATNRESNDSDAMARSSISGLHRHHQHHPSNEVPIALPVPNLSLEAQLARARRLGTQARERRRRRRRLEAGPYHYALHGLDDSITPDDSFSSDYPVHRRYQHHHHPSHAVRDEGEVLLSPLMGGPYLAPAPFLAPSSLSHSVLTHQPVFAPASLLSRRSEWSNSLALAGADLAPYPYPASNRESNSSRSAAGMTAADVWTDLRLSRDRLDGIRLERQHHQQQRQQQRQEDNEILRREVLQQVRRSALQLLPAVAEWHAQLERLSQLSPSTVVTEDAALIQETLDQMDGQIGHHWISRLRPLLLTWQDTTSTSSSLPESWFTLPPRSLFSPWIPAPPSISSPSSSVPSPTSPPRSIPPGARYF